MGQTCSFTLILACPSPSAPLTVLTHDFIFKVVGNRTSPEVHIFWLLRALKKPSQLIPVKQKLPCKHQVMAVNRSWQLLTSPGMAASNKVHTIIRYLLFWGTCNSQMNQKLYKNRLVKNPSLNMLIKVLVAAILLYYPICYQDFWGWELDKGDFIAKIR